MIFWTTLVALSFNCYRSGMLPLNQGSRLCNHKRGAVLPGAVAGGRLQLGDRWGRRSNQFGKGMLKVFWFRGQQWGSQMLFFFKCLNLSESVKNFMGFLWKGPCLSNFFKFLVGRQNYVLQRWWWLLAPFKPLHFRWFWQSGPLERCKGKCACIFALKIRKAWLRLHT